MHEAGGEGGESAPDPETEVQPRAGESGAQLQNSGPGEADLHPG